MDGQPAPTINIWQKLDFLPAIFQTLIGTAGTLLFAPFRGQYAPTTVKRHVLLSLVRRTLERLSTAQLQWLAGTAKSSYIAWTKAQKIQPEIVSLPNVQTSAFWLGDPSAATVVLYLHGGGFAMPAGDGHFKFLSQINAATSSSGKSLAFLILQYDLAPRTQYPRQLKQCVELVRYAVTGLNKPPAQLMLGGDSAGGNLVFGVLLHMLHPHPEIEPLKLSQPLRAAFVSSPWLDLDMTSDRFSGSDASDAASIGTLRAWAANYAGRSRPDEWLSPARAQVKWWNGLGSVVGEILITVAKKEVMADDVRGFAESIERTDAKVKLFVATDDFHAEPVLGSNIGLEMGEAAKFIVSWVADKC